MHKLTEMLRFCRNEEEQDKIITDYLTQEETKRQEGFLVWKKERAEWLVELMTKNNIFLGGWVDEAFEIELKQEYCECGMKLAQINSDLKCPNCNHVLHKPTQKVEIPEKISPIKCLYYGKEQVNNGELAHKINEILDYLEKTKGEK